ncbi:MAG: serine/threonine protein kinase [Polyangiaceae bacterium]|nr:serine/threonine protein kinase [Polyangiaceae bacterium]
MATIAKDTVLADRYRLLAKLGEGSMGSVWRAEHLTLGSEVAIKLLDESIARNSVGLARFMREARAAASLRSVHVVQIHDYGVFDDTPYIVMELLRGETLGTRIHRVRALNPAETALILTHVARAIGKAHETGVIHRDLKPDNIFIVNDDDEELVKVLDFGVAKAGEGVFAATLTSAGKLLGTPAYMSAEQAAGQHVDHRTDLWALAVIAFECITGTLPFVGDDLPDLLHAIHDGPIPVPSRLANVPTGFDAWFAQGVARRLDDRFRSARQMAAELRSICGVESSSTSADRFGAAGREDGGAHPFAENGEEAEPTGMQFASALSDAICAEEDETSSSRMFDDIIRTQDILTGASAEPGEDGATSGGSEDDPALPAVTAEADDEADDEAPFRTAATETDDGPLSSAEEFDDEQPTVRAAADPFSAEMAPFSEWAAGPSLRPSPASAVDAARDVVTPIPTRISSPPVSERTVPGAGTVLSVPPSRREQIGLLVGAGTAVVLVTAIAMVGYALGGDVTGETRAAGVTPDLLLSSSVVATASASAVPTASASSSATLAGSAR